MQILCRSRFQRGNTADSRKKDIYLHYLKKYARFFNTFFWPNVNSLIYISYIYVSSFAIFFITIGAKFTRDNTQGTRRDKANLRYTVYTNPNNRINTLFNYINS